MLFTCRLKLLTISKIHPKFKWRKIIILWIILANSSSSTQAAPWHVWADTGCPTVWLLHMSTLWCRCWKTCSLNIDLGFVSLLCVEMVAMWLIDFSCSFKAHPQQLDQTHVGCGLKPQYMPALAECSEWKYEPEEMKAGVHTLQYCPNCLNNDTKPHAFPYHVVKSPEMENKQQFTPGLIMLHFMF